ncbi:hypothetical protein AGMMS50296_3240 [Alphaproteobacteria bacterium]|nr:hypothetical protein AGMMS50296_3240 [Alphaproteobacteria bacterium]
MAPFLSWIFYPFFLCFFLVGCAKVSTPPPLEKATSTAQPPLPPQKRAATAQAAATAQKQLSSEKGSIPSETRKKGSHIIVHVGKCIVTNEDIRERCHMIAFFSGRDKDESFRKNIRKQVEQKLIEEAVYEQMAEQFKIDVDKGTLDSAMNDYTERFGLSLPDFKTFLKKDGILATFTSLQRTRVISSYLAMMGVQKDLLRISEKQVDEEIKKIKTDEAKPQYHLLEIVFYSDERGVLSSKNAAERTYQELLKMSKKGSFVRTFQDLAQQLSQAPSAQERGVRGWVTEEQLDGASRSLLKSMAVGSVSAPIQTRQGEHRIYFLTDKKQPGYEPESEAKLTFLVISAPYKESQEPAVRAAVSRKIEALLQSKSVAMFESIAKEYGFKREALVRPLSSLPSFLGELPLNVCSQPVLDGGELKVFWLQKKESTKTSFKIDREEIRTSLEHQKRSREAEKIFKDFKKRLLISGA